MRDLTQRHDAEKQPISNAKDEQQQSAGSALEVERSRYRETLSRMPSRQLVTMHRSLPLQKGTGNQWIGQTITEILHEREGADFIQKHLHGNGARGGQEEQASQITSEEEKTKGPGGLASLLGASSSLNGFSSEEIFRSLEQGRFLYKDGDMAKRLEVKHDGLVELTEDQAMEVMALKEEKEGRGRINEHGVFGHSGHISDGLGVIGELAPLVVKNPNALAGLKVVKMGGKFFGCINMVVLITEYEHWSRLSVEDRGLLVGDTIIGLISFFGPLGLAVSLIYTGSKLMAKNPKALEMATGGYTVRTGMGLR